MKQRIIACTVFCLLVPVAMAGVVMETEVKLADRPDKTGTESFYAQGEMTRTDFTSPSGEGGSVIFREQVMYFVDHKKKVCQKIDKKGIDQLSSQMDAMMQQMAKMPPQQREMMEKMMQGKMPGMQKPPTRRFEKSGTTQVGQYECRLVTMYSDDKKAEEVCLADTSVEADLEEAMGAIHALSRFAEALMKVAENMPFGKMFELPSNSLSAMEGFPVRTRSFNDNGEIVRESTLKSITRKEINAAVFEIPKGYKIKSLEKQLQQGR